MILVRTAGPARAVAAPSLRDLVARYHPSRLARLARNEGPRWTLNIAVALLVLSLPVAASAASASAPTASTAVLRTAAEAPRAQTVARSSTLSTGRSPVTVNADAARPIHQYTLGSADTLGSLSNYYGVSPEAIAYANGITDPLNLEVGRVIRIPPGNGALYTVAEGETLEAVASKFKVDATVIKDYNRLHFEPEHFAPGQLIFVPGAELPGLVYEAVEPVDAPAARPSVIARAPAAAPAVAAAPGGLLMPVNGVITQYMWAAHTGVDVAAPYGAPLVAGQSGIVTATGYVPIGGLRVCVTTGALENCYYHTGAVFVARGQYVERGQVIASIGMTGVTTGPHVHWETKVNGRFVNPLSYR